MLGSTRNDEGPFYATSLWGVRRFDDALRVTDECLMLAPDFGRCRVDRVATLVEFGRMDDPRREAAQLRQRIPGVTAEDFAAGFADTASDLRTRRMAAAKAVGLPSRVSARP